MQSTTPGDVLINLWTDAKSASIDWTDPNDVLSNGWTFLRIMHFHPALAEYAATHVDEREKWREVFIDPRRREEQEEALRCWLQKGLLSLSEDRWCRQCGKRGHTRIQCEQLQGSVGSELTRAAPSRIMRRFAAHQEEIERCKLLQEKQWGDDHATRASRKRGTGGRDGQLKRGQTGIKDNKTNSNNNNNNSDVGVRPKSDLTLFTEERRRGIVGRIDTQYGIGFIRVPGVGDLKFFVDRVDYGVKEIAIGDAVTLSIDSSREYPLAVDIRPERSIVTVEDVHKFLQRCKTATHPITIIKTIMLHTYDWHVVLGLLCHMSGPAFSDGVHTLVELTTFVGNREPVHIPLLGSFLSLMLRPSSDGAVAPFFPTMVQNALEGGRSMMREAEAETEAPLIVERWIEVTNLVVLLRQHTRVTNDTTAEVQSTLISLLTETLTTTTTSSGSGSGSSVSAVVPAMATAAAAKRKKVEAALRRLQRPWEEKEALMSIIPSIDCFSIIQPDPRSPFAPQNLPINGKTTYSSTEDFIIDHCRLLRADTFEAVSRILSATCFQLPNHNPTDETLGEIPHAKLYDNVRFMGRVLTRDRDYALPNSYILQVRPKGPATGPPSHLLPGTTVCITTGLDRTLVEEEEMFWGTVASCNWHLLAANMIVLAPCVSSRNFDVLGEKLKRNEQMGKTDHSCMLATNIFMGGYKSIMKALTAFVGPLAMPLPMASTLVSPEAAANASLGGKLKPKKPDGFVSYIPPHCSIAFLDLIDSIRDRFTLDEGQKEVMRCLPTSDLLLVQGPPGTGKSFIGCRLVEVYVRYKQLIASGDILRSIDVDQLQSTSVENLFPTIGPIVIITYKNHALDEFLTDLLGSGLWDDERPRIAQHLIGGASVAKSDLFPRGKRIVRIGGRSREPALDGYNLNTLLRTKTEKTVFNSLKERLFLMNQRLERLLKEIHYLESGRVPKSLFERWLTEEQRKRMRYEDRDDWLQGKQYVGTSTSTAERTLYLSILRTQLAVSLDPAQRSATASDMDLVLKATSMDEDNGAPLSIFQEMQRETESRDVNDTLHTTYLSAEAIMLAKNPPSCPDGVPEELLSLWSLHPVLRHEYYAYLIQKCISTKARDCLMIMDAIINVVMIRNHAMDELKLELLHGADVVGVTTTGCATNQNLLRSLRPSVLVVEEAAEVLESQLLACMTDSLQQVVLIGDHYQLQPKVETFLYERINRLNMSLFERLASRIRPICLTEQRRMHPSISCLVSPFYNTQNLLDHSSLWKRPFVSMAGEKYTDCVPGLAQRVFFWRHNHPEEEAPGSRSKVNMKEVDMVLKIVEHLTLEGVHQKSITVITPYLGQCRMLRTSLRLRAFSDVDVSTVDLFQGDENDIVILSLVRTERLTEFLRMRNRMIVCCSRARFAMVMLGNDTLLQQSSHWTEVLNMLLKTNCVGDRLPITYRATPNETRWMDP